MEYSDFLKAHSYTIHMNPSYRKLYLITHNLPVISRGVDLLSALQTSDMGRSRPTLSHWLVRGRIDDSAATALGIFHHHPEILLLCPIAHS